MGITGKKALGGKGIRIERVEKRDSWTRGRYATVKRVALTEEENLLLEKKGMSAGALVRQVLRAKKISFEY